MSFILRIIPVFIGWLIWRKTGSIIIGALVAGLIETFFGALIRGSAKGSSDGAAEANIVEGEADSAE